MPTVPVRKLVSTILAICLAAPLLAVPAFADSAADGTSARLSGRVVSHDGVTPLEGAVVVLVDPATRVPVASGAADADGTFTIEGAPAGAYALVAETGDVAFLAADELALVEGDNVPLSLTLNDRVPATTLAPAQSAAGTMANWAKWLIAGGIAVGALVLIDESGSEDTASEF